MFLLKSTKLRRKLLAYMFSHADKNHYVRELAACINEDPGNLSRELRQLEEEGVFKSTQRGKLKFYSLDQSYPLFHELKKIISKTVGIEAGLKELVAEFKGIAAAFIYGSYAKNTEKQTSDIDLLLVGKVDENRLTAKVRELEKTFNREINFSIYSEREFACEKTKEGGFLHLILKNKVIWLKGEKSG